MKKIAKLLVVLLALVCAISLVACAKKENNDTKTIKVGTIGPMSGDGSVYGLGVKNGYLMAIEEINAAGGVDVNGTKYLFESVGEVDDQLDSEKSVSGFNQLLTKGMQFLIGATTSGCCEAVVKANENGVLMITPSGTADTLTVGADKDDRANRGYVYRACFADSYQGRVMAVYSKNNNYDKVVIVYNPADVYSKGLYDAFMAEYGSFGTVEKVTYDTNTFGNLTASLTTAMTDADAIYIPDYYQTASSIIQQAVTAGFTGAFMGPDGFDGILSVYPQDRIADLNKVVYSNHFALDADSTAVSRFVTAYKAKYNGDPASFAALAYDATYMLKAAIESAKSTDNAKVIAALQAIEFSGVTGNITFDANGDPVKDAIIVKITDGVQGYKETLNPDKK